MNEKSTTYYVNDVLQTTHEKKLTVGTILTNANFIPVSDYNLVRKNGNKTFTDPDEEIPIHDGEKFVAVFKGTTPVS